MQNDIVPPPQRRYKIPVSNLNKTTQPCLLFPPAPAPSTLVKTNNEELLRLWCTPVATEKALGVEKHCEAIKLANQLYYDGMKEVANERGELKKLKDALRKSEFTLRTIKAKTRKERMKVRNDAIDCETDCKDQELIVEDAEHNLMMCSKTVVTNLILTCKMMKVQQYLPPTDFGMIETVIEKKGLEGLLKEAVDADADETETETETDTDAEKPKEQTAARLWLRNVSHWCFKSEAICKHVVATNYCEVSERSERAFWKTSVLAMNPAKWLQTRAASKL